MRFSRHSEPLDLDDGLPVSPADIEALHRARGLGQPDLRAYLEFLARIPPPSHEQLRRKPGPHGEPFSLVPPGPAPHQAKA